MPTVGLLVNQSKAAATEAARRLAVFLNARNVAVRAEASVADQIDGDACTVADSDALGACDFVVVFGGDGTLLGAARRLSPYRTPLLGAHLGHFGFMNEVDETDLQSAVVRILANDCRIEERLMLSVQVDSKVSGVCTLLAMNDCVVASSAVRMVYLRIRLGGETLTTYAADGVLVSTPTGSTGYSLSAGGPLVHPSVPVMIITPINPHTLNARTLVVPESETVELLIDEQTRGGVVMAVDGQVELPLANNDTVTVTQSPNRARFIIVGGPSFYQKIRERWHYGERISPDSSP